MKSYMSKLITSVLAASVCMGTALPAIPCSSESAKNITTAEAVENQGGITISNDKISSGNYKDTKYNNPISSDFFCADPTAVEYNGRLYLFGTNDHEQFEAKGPEVDNTYEKIKSMVILSTDDMVNWVYHGELNVGEVAPWIVNSWAPSITSRVEEDGLTHFYMYFSNNGLGVGVITTTDLLGDWVDPLGKPLISSNTPGLGDCPNPFDPGVVIDENGDGWLAFGGGKAANGTDYMPGTARIVKLGDDMTSFASDFAENPAPYFFEASELNYINGTYVYTYCSDWNDHSEKWEYDCDVPAGCGMVYMTTKTPLDPESWEMKGECFQNPGLAGFDYSNNHTHMQKFNDQYYMFYHTLMLKRGMGIKGSYRSLGVDKINVDEENVTIEKCGGTKKGTVSINHVDPFAMNSAAELNNTAEIKYDTSDKNMPVVMSGAEGSWISVKGVEFTEPENTGEPDAPVVLEKTAIEKISYNITVLDVDKDTTVSMYPSGKTGGDCIGSAEITGNGRYTISCDMGGIEEMMNMGYFKVDNDANITFVIDTMTINDKYDFDMSIELTNTREWADGLKNIWNGFTDGDKVYTSDFAEFRYIKSDDAIEFFASSDVTVGGGAGNAPFIEESLEFTADISGTGRIEVRLDSPTGELLTAVAFESPDKFAKVTSDEVSKIGGIHDLYFVFSDSSISFKSWKFAKKNDSSVIGDVNADGEFNVADLVTLQKYILKSGELADWQAGDLNEDGIINSFDLSMMRKMIAK